MPASDKKIIVYFAEWAIYARNHQVSDLPASQITHINYAFAQLNYEGDVSIYDSWAAVEKPFGNDTWESPLKGTYHALQVLKSQNPHLKTLISVGGWSLSQRFSDIALTDESRLKFAESAVKFMHKYQFDGIDIDWEYPVSGGEPGNRYRPEDGENYVKLVKEVRSLLNSLEKETGLKYLLTIASPAGYDKIANFKLSEMEPYLDWFNLMTYDYHGSWEPGMTNHHAPLYANPKDPSS
jgi:chitinase